MHADLEVAGTDPDAVLVAERYGVSEVHLHAVDSEMTDASESRGR